MHKTFYLFKNKTKSPKDDKKEREHITFVKVVTTDDMKSEDIKDRYHISDDFLFCGIYDVSTNQLISKEPSLVEEEINEKNS